ncbi:hypothetical protein HYY75_02060 [bacterium]|nr:hypothetical protein [bacterium]
MKKNLIFRLTIVGAFLFSQIPISFAGDGGSFLDTSSKTTEKGVGCYESNATNADYDFNGLRFDGSVHNVKNPIGSGTRDSLGESENDNFLVVCTNQTGGIRPDDESGTMMKIKNGFFERVMLMMQALINNENIKTWTKNAFLEAGFWRGDSKNKRQHKPFAITKEIDASSPLFKTQKTRKGKPSLHKATLDELPSRTDSIMVIGTSKSSKATLDEIPAKAKNGKPLLGKCTLDELPAKAKNGKGALNKATLDEIPAKSQQGVRGNNAQGVRGGIRGNAQRGIATGNLLEKHGAAKEGVTKAKPSTKKTMASDDWHQ